MSVCLAYGLLSGLRPGDEILVLNGREVSSLDLGLIQKLFAEDTLRLTLRRDPPSQRRFPDDYDTLLPNPPHTQDTLRKPHRAKSSTGKREQTPRPPALCTVTMVHTNNSSSHHRSHTNKKLLTSTHPNEISGGLLQQISSLLNYHRVGCANVRAHTHTHPIRERGRFGSLRSFPSYTADK